jgi:putative phage-type endonuclease
MKTIDRKHGIGASEVPAVLGQSPWRTPVAVWLEKVGLSEGQRGTDAMSVGRMLEGPLLRAAADFRREKLTHNAVTFAHPDWPHVPLFATPDGFTRRHYGLVEIKVVGHRWSDWRDGPPPYVVSQVQAQIACYPKAAYAVVVALLGSEVKTFDIAADREVIDALEMDAIDWWNSYVVPEQAPPAETTDDRWALARALAGRVAARTSRLPSPAEDELARQLAVAKDHAEHAADVAEALRLELAEVARDRDLTGATWSATWAKRRTTDWKGLATEFGHPSDFWIEKYTTETPSFTFRRRAAAE